MEIISHDTIALRVDPATGCEPNVVDQLLALPVWAPPWPTDVHAELVRRGRADGLWPWRANGEARS